MSRAESKDGRASARRGDGYEAFCDAGWPLLIDEKRVSKSEAAESAGASLANVSRWMAAWADDEKLRKERESWSLSEDAAAALEDFGLFRDRYFRTELGEVYETAPFHVRWISAILEAMAHGRRQLILSPPRHGKTELLIHFVIWCIVRNPNIRIMWVGGNEDIAKNSVQAVLDQLESNELLVRDFCPPGSSFKPAAKSGRSWSQTKLTVSTRTVSGIKSPTLIAVGKGGKLLSRDADLIVTDDIVDHESVSSPAQRESDVKWFNTQLSSRKEAHTALVAIGSRQHHLDLWGHLASLPVWSRWAIIESAHDPACELPQHSMIDEDHDADVCPDCVRHVECMLWPHKRTYAFVQDQRAATADDQLHEMVYQNRTRPDSDVYLTEEHLVRCHDLERRIGHIPTGARLVAGLDPASVRMQAAFLWAYDPVTQMRFMVDVELQPGGSTPGARKIIQLWDELYGCKTWVIERNNFQLAILQDRDVVDYKNAHGITLLPSFTDRWNKWDKNFGVTAQMALFRKDPPRVNLPWGDEETRLKVRAYQKQLLEFDPEGKAKQDIVMAAWFPETKFRQWRKEHEAETESAHEQTEYPQMMGETYAA